MVRSFKPFYIPLCLSSLQLVCADAPSLEDEENFSGAPLFPVSELVAPSREGAAALHEPTHAPVTATPVATEVPVKPFTGKVKARKVRMRVKADLDSRVVKELQKNDLVMVVGEKGEFWAIEAPLDTKAYVFRSFILDNVVEGHNVNVRLEPNLDAPIIAHLDSGDTLTSPAVSAVNPKWFEITPPSSTRFYVAKNYIEFAGGPEVKLNKEKRRDTAEHLMDASLHLSQTEMKKPFNAIDFDKIISGYHTLINDYSEFTELAEQAQETLSSLQEEYLQKRIAYLEVQQAEEIATKQESHPSQSSIMSSITDKMRLWQPIEEALYLSWSNLNDNKDLNHYYEEQRLAAVEISGFIEPYTTPVKNRPGDFIIRDKDVPIAYVYSTQVNLQNLVGTQVKLVAAPRPNHNFAFPAYYVLSAE